MTIDEILTQVDSMRGLAKELSGDARVFVLKACVELDYGICCACTTKLRAALEEKSNAS
jgi:hypothetical protein